MTARAPDPEIRPARRSDLPGLAELYGLCFEEKWALASVENLLSTPGTWALMAWSGPVPLGFVLARAIAGEAEILSLAVHPDHRRQGLSRGLMQAAFTAARPAAEDMFLEVGTDNPAAIALYRGLGFEEVGRRKNYYRRADRSLVDALILKRPL